MGGHVFQFHSEQRKKGQFEETMGALKTFISMKYVSYIECLIPIFVDFLQPVLTKITLLIVQTTVILKNDTALVRDSCTREESEEYRLKLKNFLKDEKTVKTTNRSLHSVLWGQGSHILREEIERC